MYDAHNADILSYHIRLQQHKGQRIKLDIEGYCFKFASKLLNFYLHRMKREFIFKY